MKSMSAIVDKWNFILTRIDKNTKRTQQQIVRGRNIVFWVSLAAMNMKHLRFFHTHGNVEQKGKQSFIQLWCDTSENNTSGTWVMRRRKWREGGENENESHGVEKINMKCIDQNYYAPEKISSLMIFLWRSRWNIKKIFLWTSTCAENALKVNQICFIDISALHSISSLMTKKRKNDRNFDIWHFRDINYWWIEKDAWDRTLHDKERICNE